MVFGDWGMVFGDWGMVFGDWGMVFGMAIGENPEINGVVLGI
jgi:hypothetical protein